MYSKLFKLAMLPMLLFVLIASGCATVFKGSSEKVSFSSDQPGTKVYVNGQFMGTTPVETKLMSKNSYIIEFRKDGYQSKTVMLNNSVGAGWVVLDVILGGFPVVIDAISGDWYRLDRDHVIGNLEKI